MKKHILILPLFVASLFACGSKSNTEEKSPEKGTEEMVESKILDPLKADFSKPLDPQTLFESMKVYYTQEIQMIVYPISYLGKEKFSEGMGCSSTSGSDEKDIYISWKALPSGEFTSKTPYLIKGKVYKYGYFNAIELFECELIGEAKDKKGEAFDPQKINSETIYKVDGIIKSMLAWKGKTVTVVGDYLSTTVSKSLDGTKTHEIRVDLGKDGGYDFVVGCAFKENPENKLKAGMKNVKIKGTLDSELHYDRPYLTDCIVL